MASNNHSRLGSITPLNVNKDERGILIELWRNDTHKELNHSSPMMSYVSNTLPGVVRGPHEHKWQTDYFFFYQGKLELHLWNKDGSVHEIHEVGAENPVMVKVPPGVIHAYKNVGDTAVDIVNMPDKLYRGFMKREQVDEIRHEADPNTIYKLDHCPVRVVIVTGAAGFIGYNFCHKAKDAGFEVLATDKEAWNQNARDLKSQGFHFTAGDISNPKLWMQEMYRYILSKFKDPEVYLVNFAAETHNDRSFGSPGEFVRANVEGVVQTFKSFWAEIPWAKKMVHVSTDEVYGPIKTGVSREGDPLRPTSPYASSKMAGEIMLRSVYESTPGVHPLCITRGANTYGPRQHPEKFLPMILTRVLQGKKYPVYQPVTAERSWLSVDDHCDGILAVIERGEDGQVYNIGRAGTIPNQSFIDNVARLLVARNVLKYNEIIELGVDVGNPRGAHHDVRYNMSAEKLEKLGWTSKTVIMEGLASTIDWYAKNDQWWRTIVESTEFKKYMETMYPTLEVSAQDETPKATEEKG